MKQNLSIYLWID